MIVLIRSNDIVSDPRAMKYVRFMDGEAIENKRIAWDREGNAPPVANVVYYKKKAGYNVGGLKAVKDRVGWMQFVIKTLRAMRLKDVTLHGCDLDAAFPAAVYKVFINHKARVIFDVFDWFSATLYNQKWYIKAAFKVMERFSVKNSNHVIICEPERREQIPFKIPEGDLSVLPNIPYFNNGFCVKDGLELAFNNDLVTFAYVGGFSEERCLSEIIDIAEEGIINLLIAGFGNEKIEKRLNSLRVNNHIRYFGKVKYEYGLNIMYNADIVYAMYSVVNPNNIYAAPNKVYEAMMLGKPIFTTVGTIVESKIKKMGIGYVSGESKDEIISVINTLDKEDMKIKGNISRELWTNKYSNYTDNYMRTIYNGVTQY